VPLRHDFRPGVPDVTLFPRGAWSGALRRTLREAPDVALGYGDPHGAAELRGALSSYLGRVRGVVADPSQILICTGFAQGLGLLCRSLRAAGVERVAVEDPTHPGQRAIIAHAGLLAVPVPVDEDGLRVDALAHSGAQAVLVTPAHQFPSGVVLAPARRAALIAWVRHRNAVVIEDDYDAEYRYDRAPVGALQGLAPDHVVYAGSASKTLAPALRLGWMVAPARLVEALAAAKHHDDLGSPTLEQLAFARFLEAGHLDHHLRRARAIYRSRRDGLVRSLARQAPAVRVQGIAAGLHAVVRLPDSTDEVAVVAAAKERGVGVYGISEYALDCAHPPALVLGYAALTESAIAAGIATLARVL
jgi:GntR family transcriptional regulator/MocR family aminotransferase